MKVILFVLISSLLLSSSFTVSSYGAEIERGKGFAIVEIQDIEPTEWLEGQQLTVTLTEEDMKQNFKAYDNNYYLDNFNKQN